MDQCIELCGRSLNFFTNSLQTLVVLHQKGDEYWWYEKIHEVWGCHVSMISTHGVVIIHRYSGDSMFYYQILSRLQMMMKGDTLTTSSSDESKQEMDVYLIEMLRSRYIDVRLEALSALAYLVSHGSVFTESELLFQDYARVPPEYARLVTTICYHAGIEIPHSVVQIWKTWDQPQLQRMLKKKSAKP